MSKSSERYYECNVQYMDVASMTELLNRYHAVLKYAHNAILHEIDNGRTPELIKEGNGGAGIGLIEDLLNEK